MKGRSKKYYRKIFRAYPDMVTLLQFREMLGGVSDNFARKLIHEKHVKSIFIKPHYYISKNSVIDYVLSEDYAKRKVRNHTMKKTYKIEVDCANCANLMEDAARKTSGVQSATVNFMTQKMIVEFAEGQEPASVMDAVQKACKKVEPDCEIFL